jgi:hypothetical protein
MEQPVTFGNVIEFLRVLRERGLEGKWPEFQDVLNQFPMLVGDNEEPA